MIILLRNQVNLPVITSKVTRNIDYTDNLEFAVTTDVDVRLEDIVRVKSNLVNEDYRVYEITSDGFEKRIFCKSVFFDSQDIVLDIPIVDTNNVTLWSLANRLNVYLREKDTVFKIEVESAYDKEVTVEAQRVSLYDLLFDEEKGLCNLYNLQVGWNNRTIIIRDQEKEGKNTEILFHENKNIASLDFNTNKKELVTKLYVAATYKPSEEEKKRLAEEKKKLEEEEKKKKEAEKKAAEGKEEPKKKTLDEIAYLVIMGRYGNGRPRVDKLTKEGYNAREVQKRVNQLIWSGTWKKLTPKQKEEATKKEEEVATEEYEREVNAGLSKEVKEEEEKDIIFYTTYTSPIANQYSRIYEGVLEFESEEISTQELLEKWCKENLFNEKDTRDVPLTTYTFTPAAEDYRVDLFDKAKVKYTRIGIDKVVKCVEFEYDPQNDKYISINFGSLKTNPRTESMREVRGQISSSRREYRSNNEELLRRLGLSDAEYKRQMELDTIAYELDFITQKEKIETRVEEGIQEAKDKAIEIQANIEADINDRYSRQRESIISEVNVGIEEAKTKAEQDSEILKKEIADSISGATEDIPEIRDAFNKRIDDSKNDLVSIIDTKISEIDIPDLDKIVDSKIANLPKDMTKLIETKLSNYPTDIKVGARNYVLNSSISIASKRHDLDFAFPDKESLQKLRGQEITLSGFIQSRGNSGANGWGFTIVYADNRREGFQLYSDNEVVNNKWLNGTFTVADKEIKAIENGYVFTNGGAVAFPQLEISNVASNWRPAEEDNKNYLDDKIAHYQQDNNGIIANIRAVADGAKQVANDTMVTATEISNRLSSVEGRFDSEGNPTVFNEYKNEVKRTIDEATSKIDSLETKFDENGKLIELTETTSGIKQTTDNLATELGKVTSRFDDQGKLKDFVEFKTQYDKTAKEEKTTFDKIETYINQDGTRKTELLQSAKSQAADLFKTEITKATGNLVEKNTYEEDVRETRRQFNEQITNIKAGVRNYILNSNICTTETQKDFKLSTEDYSIFRGKTVIISADAEAINAGGSINGRSRQGVEVSVEFADGTVFWGVAAFNTEANFKGRLSTKITIPDKEIRVMRAYVQNEFSSGTSRICRPMLIISDISADYQPAQEDIVNSVATYTSGIDRKVDELVKETGEYKKEVSKFEQTVDGFTSTVSRVETKYNDLSVDGRNYIANSDRLIYDEVAHDIQFVDLDLQTLRGKEIILSADVETQNASGNSGHSYGRVGWEPAIEFEDGSIQWLENWTTNRNYRGRISQKHKIWDKPIRRIHRVIAGSQFKNGYAAVSKMKFEIGTIPTGYSLAPEDLKSVAMATHSSLNQRIDLISGSVTSLEENVLKKSEIEIRDDRIILGAGNEINGNKMASIISVQPDALKTITDKFVVTNQSENYIKEFSNRNGRQRGTKYLTPYIDNRDDFLLKWDEKFLLKGISSRKSGTSSADFNIIFKMRDGREIWKSYGSFNNDFVYNVGREKRKVGMFNNVFDDIQTTDVVAYRFAIWADGNTEFEYKDLELIKQKDADFIVEGSIESKHIKSMSINASHIEANAISSDLIAADAITSRHIKTNSILAENIASDTINSRHLMSDVVEGRHLKMSSIDAGKIAAGAVESSHIKANAIESKHIKVDEALIRNITSHTTVTDHLWANEIFSKKIQGIKITANNFSGDMLEAKNKYMKINLSNGHTSYEGDAKIEFKSNDNALFYRNDSAAAFLNFTDVGIPGDAGAGLILGVDNDKVLDASHPRFSGIVISRSSSSTDQLQLISDIVYLRPGANEQNGIDIRTAALKGTIDLVEMLKAFNENFRRLKLRSFNDLFW